jgi:tetrahydromethanopterin S-methyltransferase subunit G
VSRADERKGFNTATRLRLLEIDADKAETKGEYIQKLFIGLLITITGGVAIGAILAMIQLAGKGGTP